MDTLLLDKQIIRAQLSDDGYYLKLITPEKEIVLNATGDCCSHSWIQDATIWGTLGKVVEIEEIKTGSVWDSPEENELTQFYMKKIKMDTGVLEIEFRNNSNGYYGGDLVIEGEYGYEEPPGNINWRDVP